MSKEIKHISGAAGGYLVGKSHKNGGIQAINKAIGKPLEMEGGEVVITKPAVEDNELREFEGEMLTNRQILSKINESGGGISFAEKGAELPTQIEFCGTEYKYGGETLTDYQIAHRISKCGCNHDEDTYADGGEISNEVNKLNGTSLDLYNRASYTKTENQNNRYHTYDGYSVYSTLEEKNKIFVEKSPIYFSNEIEAHEYINKQTISPEKNTPFWLGTEEMYEKYKKSFAEGGLLSDSQKSDLYQEWKKLVNMSATGLQLYYDSSEGKDSGLSASEAKEQGIKSGRESARWIIKMKNTNVDNWTPQMWEWAKRQVSFIKRMTGIPGELYDENGTKTRKHKALLIWGHDPEKHEQGGNLEKNLKENAVNVAVNATEALPVMEKGGNVEKRTTAIKTTSLKHYKELLAKGVKAELVTKQDLNKFEKGGELQTLDNLSIQRKVDDVEFQLIKLVLPIFENLKVYDIINLSEKIAKYDKKERDAQTTAEAIQYLTQDFSNFDKTNPIYEKAAIKRLEDLDIIPKINNDNKPSNEITELVISPDNNLSQQLVALTGDYWNAHDFANIDESIENLSFMQPFYHKETGKKFVVIDPNMQPKKETRKPKYDVGSYVSYETGDLETEKWLGIVKEVKDYGNEIKYRLDAYTKNVDPPMFDSENTNEVFEASLNPSTKVNFNKAKAAYEWYQDSKSKSKKVYDLNSSWSGGAVVVYDRNQNENGDYKTIAHVFSTGEIKYFEDNLPQSVIDYVQEVKHPSNENQIKKEEKPKESDQQFTYMMLSRLKSDNDYFLGYGNRHEKHLWADNVKDHIAEMKRLWNSLEIKPEWLSMEDILNYEKQMTDSQNNLISTETKTYQISDYKNPYEVNRAIEKLIDSKENDFTPNEIEFISHYSGYGGLEKQGSFSDEELKGLLYEYFTPDAVVKKMWALAYKYGFGTFSNPHIMEPSVGTGNFFKYAPTEAELFGNEINNYSKRVCEILYPKAMITLQPFEKNFISKNNSIKNKLNDVHKYHLVIGNPPYGRAVSKYLAMGESDYTKATSFTEYFITRGLDLLHPGGLLIFVVGAEQYNGGTLFLDSGISVVKKNIFDKAQLVDAYRLPTKIFERTGVASEILVFKKK